MIKVENSAFRVLTLRIQHPADLRQVAISLDGVFNRRRFHEEGVAAFSFLDTFHTLVIACCEHRGALSFHRGPHLLICREVWVLVIDTLHYSFWCRWRVKSNYSLTLKKETVLPPFNAPYLILVCFAKSSALSIGESIRSTVRNAAKLAV